MITAYMFMQMMIGMFFALAYVQRIWRKSVTTFIMSNMMFGFVVLQELKEDVYGYALVTVCMAWMYYRAIFKESSDKWLSSSVKIQFKED